MTPESESLPLEIRPVGVVRLPADEKDAQVVEVLAEHADCLLRIEGAKELQILYWMHRLSEADRRVMSAHPRGDTSKPRRGVFALRSPMRPNPIGSTVVRLENVDGARLTVSGLDAFDGSPVLDIKIAS